MSYSIKMTAGSNAVVNNTVAIPAVINDGHKIATTRCINGVLSIATYYTLINVMYIFILSLIS